MNARAVSAVVGFAFLTAVVDVYAGSLFQSLAPAEVVAISFSLACVLFTGIGLARYGMAALRPFVDQRRDVLAINVTTAVAWLTVLFSLQYIEPAIVNVASQAFLRRQGLIPAEQPRLQVDPVDALLGRYQIWLRRERRLGEQTVGLRLMWARKFLSAQSSTGVCGWSGLIRAR